MKKAFIGKKKNLVIGGHYEFVSVVAMRSCDSIIEWYCRCGMTELNFWSYLMNFWHLNINGHLEFEF